MPPQLRVHRLRAFTTITKKFVIVAIANEATLFVGDQTVFTLGDKPFAHAFKICRIEIAIRCVAIMHQGMGRRLLWMLVRHFSTLVSTH